MAIGRQTDGNGYGVEVVWQLDGSRAVDARRLLARGRGVRRMTCNVHNVCRAAEDKHAETKNYTKNSPQTNVGRSS